ncbi:MAG: hypothetical protein LBC87_05635 [Fibromonadaceae bacterium]|jgi:DNA topoisomerase VI subunit A|nr:hypothetical protein [Fibromonadaceae bacterium]
MTPPPIELIIPMSFGLCVFIFGLYACAQLKDDELDLSSVHNSSIKSTKTSESSSGHKLMLSYLKLDDILGLNAEQINSVDDADVEKLPTVLKDAFKRRRNEVMFEERKKEANKGPALNLSSDKVKALQQSKKK